MRGECRSCALNPVTSVSSPPQFFFFPRTLPPPPPGIQRTSSRRSVTARGRTFDDGAGHVLRGVGGPTIPQHHRRRRRGACGQCCFACLEKDFFDSNRLACGCACACACITYWCSFPPRYTLPSPSSHINIQTHTNIRSIFLHSHMSPCCLLRYEVILPLKAPLHFAPVAV